jgi:hypothetical protein
VILYLGHADLFFNILCIICWPYVFRPGPITSRDEGRLWEENRTDRVEMVYESRNLTLLFHVATLHIHILRLLTYCSTSHKCRMSPTKVPMYNVLKESNPSGWAFEHFFKSFLTGVDPSKKPSKTCKIVSTRCKYPPLKILNLDPQRSVCMGDPDP